MKYWSTLLVAALGLALVGCGGSGGGGRDDDDNNPPPGDTGPSVRDFFRFENGQPKFGTVDLAYVPGAGRAPGDMWAIFRRAYLDDGLQPQPVQTITPQKLQLNRYSSPLQIPLSVDFRQTSQETRRFQDFTLDIESLEYENEEGNIIPLTDINGIPYTFTGLADIRVFPGRRTGLQIFLDTTMFSVDDPLFPTEATFNAARFREVNIFDEASGNKIQGFLADYLSFDVSQLPNAKKPKFSDNGAIANRMFFSGDGYAIGDSPTQSNKYEALTLNTFQPIAGRFSPPTVIAGRQTPGTYSLLQNDPSQVDPENAKVISLVGIWYEHYFAVKNMGTTQMIAFPRSRDDNFQDVVLVNQTKEGDRYIIRDLKWGYIEYSVDTRNNRIYLYEAKDITNGAGATPVATGTVTDLKNGSGQPANTADEVRTAKYNLTGGTSGTLIVFRK